MIDNHKKGYVVGTKNITFLGSSIILQLQTIIQFISGVHCITLSLVFLVGFGAPYGYSPAGALPPYGKLTVPLGIWSIIHPFDLFIITAQHLSFFSFSLLFLRFSFQNALSSCPSHQSPHNIPRHPPLPLLGPSPHLTSPHLIRNHLMKLYLLSLDKRVKSINQHWISQLFDHNPQSALNLPVSLLYIMFPLCCARNQLH